MGNLFNLYHAFALICLGNDKKYKVEITESPRESGGYSNNSNQPKEECVDIVIK